MTTDSSNHPKFKHQPLCRDASSSDRAGGGSHTYLGLDGDLMMWQKMLMVNWVGGWIY